jgi:hypothetical protein
VAVGIAIVDDNEVILDAMQMAFEIKTTVGVVKVLSAPAAPTTDVHPKSSDQ